MEKTSNQHVESFIKKYGHEFDGVSDAELKLIINSPFKAFASQLKEGILESFRIKYLGLFTIHENKLKSVKKHIIKKYKNGEIPEKYYQGIKKAIIDYEQTK